MPQTINIYCDESCHLEHDHQLAMVLGAIWCPLHDVASLADASRALKADHGLSKTFELKWGKVSPAQLAYYRAVLAWFWATPSLHYRGLIVPDKKRLDHEKYGQTHDEWYYKMYFDMLKVIIDPKSRYNVYLDIKDTRGTSKVRKLHEVLSNAHYDFSRTIIQRVQLVRSHEIEMVQLADFLTGALSYVNRELTGSPAKLELVNELRRLSGYSLTSSTLLRENKLNLFRWHSRDER